MPTEEWKKGTPDLHLDPRKDRDPVEELIRTRGFEEAVDKIIEQFKKNPDDPELRRQANLIMNRCDDLANGLRKELSH